VVDVIRARSFVVVPRDRLTGPGQAVILAGAAAVVLLVSFGPLFGPDPHWEPWWLVGGALSLTYYVGLVTWTLPWRRQPPEAKVKADGGTFFLFGDSAMSDGVVDEVGLPSEVSSRTGEGWAWLGDGLLEVHTAGAERNSMRRALLGSPLAAFPGARVFSGRVERVALVRSRPAWAYDITMAVWFSDGTVFHFSPQRTRGGQLFNVYGRKRATRLAEHILATAQARDDHRA
jgi:hypothetical protein